MWKEIEYFDPFLIMDSGQNHHFSIKENEEGREICLVDGQKALKISENKNLDELCNNVYRAEGEYIFHCPNRDLDYWANYFDFNRDYGGVQREISVDLIMKEAVKLFPGLRVLKQDPYECILSFIISQNSNIKRIRKNVEGLAKLYGQELGNDMYALPKAHVLAGLDPAELRTRVGLGYRDRYLVESAKMLDKGMIDFETCYKAPLDEARKELMKLVGVGEKVADCILLFAFGRLDSFPVDVWIHRIMQRFYNLQGDNRKKTAIYGREYFGRYAGLAQQYLFQYARRAMEGS